MSQSEAPIVDEERIQETYDGLGKMHVKLDPNPIEYGPKRFNNKIAETRAMLTRLEQLFLQLSEDLHWFKREILRKKTVYELDKRNLMVTNLNVRAGRSQGEREAFADVELREQLEEVQLLDVTVQDLEMLMIVIKAKRTDLKDIQGRMRDQMKLIEHDISMGARWGRIAPPDPLGTTSSDIDDMIQQVDNEGSWSLEDDEKPAEEKPAEAEAEEPHVEKPPPQSANDPVLEFGVEEDEDEEESISHLLDSAIPTEGAEGKPIEGSEEEDPLEAGADQTDADDFLNNFSMEDENESPDAVERGNPLASEDGPGIDELIATLADDP